MEEINYARYVKQDEYVAPKFTDDDKLHTGSAQDLQLKWNNKINLLYY